MRRTSEQTSESSNKEPLQNLQQLLGELHPSVIYDMYFTVREYLYFWPGRLYSEFLDSILDSIPLLAEIFDADKIRARASSGPVESHHGDDHQNAKTEFPELV